MQYRLKDWGISRQRYWGTPIPVLYCEKGGMVPVPDDELPVVLPKVAEFSGRGDSPLAQIPEFVNATCPKCGGPARRETDTMDTFVDSSWYFFRFCDPTNDAAAVRSRQGRLLGPGRLLQRRRRARHPAPDLLAVLLPRVPRPRHDVIDEPFTRLLTQGMVLKDGQVMSKSKGNVVDPDDMIQKFGADALRLYVMFVAPPGEGDRVDRRRPRGQLPVPRARLAARRSARRDDRRAKAFPSPATLELNDAERALRRKTHETIRRVTLDLDPRVHLNTAVSALMELVNELYAFCEARLRDASAATDDDATSARSSAPRTVAVLKEAVEALVLMLSPFAPHMAEELWERLGTPAASSRPAGRPIDEAVAKAEEIVVPVQVNGKVRARLTVPAERRGGHAARSWRSPIACRSQNISKARR